MKRFKVLEDNYQFGGTPLQSNSDYNFREPTPSRFDDAFDSDFFDIEDEQVQERVITPPAEEKQVQERFRRLQSSPTAQTEQEQTAPPLPAEEKQERAVTPPPAQEAAEYAPAGGEDNCGYGDRMSLLWQQVMEMVMRVKPVISAGQLLKANKMLDTARDVMIEFLCVKSGIEGDFAERADELSDEDKGKIFATYPRSMDENSLYDALSAIINTIIRAN
ncbi:MAG: hypothetical protein LBL82_03565 [Oscillospiraceae bacterium]|jgi:hypothetical protein|nr:hypothetical protein [Oscillospiraceae bacterium]